MSLWVAGTKKAISYLRTGRTNTALQLYCELLDAYEPIEGSADLENRRETLLGNEPVGDAETDIWYDDRVLCLERLSKWRELHDQVCICSKGI